MLYFCNRNHEDKTWHVGNKVPVMDDIVEIQADGHELQWIENHVQGFVTPGVLVQVWKGDRARDLYKTMRIYLGTKKNTVPNAEDVGNFLGEGRYHLTESDYRKADRDY